MWFELSTPCMWSTSVCPREAKLCQSRWRRHARTCGVVLTHSFQLQHGRTCVSDEWPRCKKYHGVTEKYCTWIFFLNSLVLVALLFLLSEDVTSPHLCRSISPAMAVLARPGRSRQDERSFDGTSPVPLLINHDQPPKIGTSTTPLARFLLAGARRINSGKGWRWSRILLLLLKPGAPLCADGGNEQSMMYSNNAWALKPQVGVFWVWRFHARLFLSGASQWRPTVASSHHSSLLEIVLSIGKPPSLPWWLVNLGHLPRRNGRSTGVLTARHGHMLGGPESSMRVCRFELGWWRARKIKEIHWLLFVTSHHFLAPFLCEAMGPWVTERSPCPAPRREATLK